MTRERLVLYGGLILIGAAWGITQPFAKIAVSEGYRHVGIIFWQFALGGVLLAAINRSRGRGLPMERRHIALYAIIALIGTLLPNSASYTAAIHLPSGILSIVLSLVPMMAFPIALALGMDRFSAWRSGPGFMGEPRREIWPGTVIWERELMVPNILMPSRPPRKPCC